MSRGAYPISPNDRKAWLEAHIKAWKGCQCDVETCIKTPLTSSGYNSVAFHLCAIRSDDTIGGDLRYCSKVYRYIRLLDSVHVWITWSHSPAVHREAWKDSSAC
jgi:hypothetical protein